MFWFTSVWFWPHLLPSYFPALTGGARGARVGRGGQAAVQGHRCWRDSSQVFINIKKYSRNNHKYSKIFIGDGKTLARFSKRYPRSFIVLLIPITENILSHVRFKHGNVEKKPCTIPQVNLRTYLMPSFLQLCTLLLFISISIHSQPFALHGSNAPRSTPVMEDEAPGKAFNLGCFKFLPSTCLLYYLLSVICTYTLHLLSGSVPRQAC